MGIHENGLRIGITDDANALIARKRVEFVLKLRAEIVALQIMDFTAEAFFFVKHHHTGTLGAEVRVVVCAVEQIVHTALRADGSKKTSHVLDKIVQERCNTLKGRLALSLNLNLKFDLSLADTTQVLNVVQLRYQAHL